VRNRRRTLGAPLLFVAVSVGTLVVSARARAQAGEADAAAPGVDVSWTAPGECPSSDELRHRVTARAPGDAAVRARGRVEKHAGRYRVALEITTASSRGERALDASTCDALASSAAVVIAMSVAPAAERAREEAAASASAPSVSSDGPPAAPAPPAAASAPPVPSSPERSSPAPAAGADRTARVLLRAELAGDAGLLPSATVGGGVALGVVLFRDLALEANADLFATKDGTVESSPARGASFALFTIGARACWALTHGIEVAPCLGVEVARIGASGFGAAKVSDADSLTWGPEALLGARLPVTGPLSVRFGLGAFVPISRQSFVINAAGTVHQPQAVALRTWAGPEVRF
jgi:hypothetical protein